MVEEEEEEEENGEKKEEEKRCTITIIIIIISIACPHHGHLGPGVGMLWQLLFTTEQPHHVRMGV